MRTYGRCCAGLLALAGCADAAAPEGGSGVDATGGTAQIVTSTTAASETEPGTSGPATTSGPGTATTPSSTDPTVPTSDGSTGIVPPPDFPPVPPKYCDLQSVDPSVDPQTAIDAGDGPGQIPTIIGEALLRNCGCHYGDTLEYVDYTTEETPLDTHAAFHATFNGIFPMEFQGMPVYLAVEQRVVYGNPLPMPTIECDVEGEPGVITEADKQLFADWLAAGAPDGASWP